MYPLHMPIQVQDTIGLMGILERRFVFVLVFMFRGFTRHDSAFNVRWSSKYWVCGLAVTAGIAMKFGTAHGRSRPGVGGAKCIGSYGRKGVPWPPVILVLLSKN